MSKAGFGRKTRVDVIQEAYPKLLHELYRYSISVLGCDAKASHIINLMNRKALITKPECHIHANLGLNTYHFWLFFHRNNGTLTNNTSKPRLSKEQKEARVKWCRDMQNILRQMKKDEELVCFLDEKQFFTCSRRKRRKHLPRAEFETELQAHMPVRRVQ